MKPLPAYLAVLISLTPLLAQAAPAAWPMPPLPPANPPGTNSAVAPSPRIEWLQRVSAIDAKAHPIASNIHLVFDGDSITDFWQGKGQPIWQERYAKLGAFDFAIAGDRTEHLLWRLSQGQVDGVRPKLIVLMIGTNNLGGNTPEQIAEGIRTIVAEYQKRCPGAVILLQAVFPRGQQASDPNRAKIKEINSIISKLGDGKKVIYVDFGDKFLEPDGTLSAEIMPDFLHPSLKGYQIWADAIQPVIDKYFPGGH
jgi:lysophospholipase L1-like esterase